MVPMFAVTGMFGRALGRGGGAAGAGEVHKVHDVAHFRPGRSRRRGRAPGRARARKDGNVAKAVNVVNVANVTRFRGGYSPPQLPFGRVAIAGD